MGLFSIFIYFRCMNKSKLNYSNRTKIILYVLLFLLAIYIGIGEDPLFGLFTSMEGGLALFIVFILFKQKNP